MEDIRKSRRFLFSAVRGDLGGELSSLYRLAVVLSAPQTVRLRRLRQRSYDRFGARLLEGGDLYAQEEAFFRFAAERSPLDAVSWLDALSSVRSCTSTGAGTAAVLPVRSLRILRKSFIYPAAANKKSLPTAQSGGFFCSYIRA